MGTEGKLRLVILFFIGLLAYGYWNVSRPDVFPMSFMRGEVRQISPWLFAGPYPSDAELSKLKAMGVEEVVSLMSSSVPLEGGLIERERKSAEANGIGFKNFPIDFSRMSSRESDKQVDAALKHISSRGSKRIYVHCYLGRHRVGRFEKALRSGKGGL